ncbi:MAG: hypothetical protein FD164_1239 [Nitrospirae bacterium]|nr:MAG: hypothetical protein FD164_1239 [Nitrospirota bacterium]
MKILLSVPGHLKTVPMNEYVYQTLQTMGFEVRLFNFGAHDLRAKLLKKLSRNRYYHHMNRQVQKIADEFNPDVFLTIFGFDHDRTLIEYLRNRNIITVCWWLNDPFQLRRSLEKASFYDYYFTNAEGSVDEYRRQGIRNAHFLPVGAYPPVHRVLPDRARQHDICFAGDWGPGREEVLTALARDFRLSIWGPWKKHLDRRSLLQKCIVRDGFFTPEEMVVMFNRSRIVLNLHSWFGKYHFGINPRLFEANGCGAFQLCDFKDEIPRLYEPGIEIALYTSIDDLRSKLSYYLGADNERTEIALRGWRKTIEKHTYTNRLQEMFYNIKLKI